MEKCLICGAELPTTSAPNRKYCSAQCRRRANLSENRLKVLKDRALNRKKREEIAYYEYDRKCALCGWHIDNGPMGGCELHHIIPVSMGGSDEKENLILLCPNCHKLSDIGIYSRDYLRSHVIVYDDEERLYVNADRLAEKYREFFG